MPNAKFYGFTEYSLGMYSRLFVDSADSLDHVDMMEMLGATSMKDITKWCDENLVDSAYDKKTAFNKALGIVKKPREKTKKRYNSLHYTSLTRKAHINVFSPS